MAKKISTLTIITIILIAFEVAYYSMLKEKHVLTIILAIGLTLAVVAIILVKWINDNKKRTELAKKKEAIIENEYNKINKGNQQ